MHPYIIGGVYTGALTEKGFKRPIYAEILETQIAKAKELFGEDIETDEKTAFGKFVRMTVYDLAKAYEELELLYYSRFPNTAFGVSLDRLCVFAGITRNPATYAIHEVVIKGTPGYTIPVGFLVGTKENISFYTENSYTIQEDGAVLAEVRCTELGLAGNVPFGSIERIVNPHADIESIEHQDVKELAMDEESDEDLRKRLMETIAGGGSATANAIRGAIMRVPNVTGCIIVENEGDTADEAGRPPRSFECFVVSPESQYQLIGNAIFDKKPLGIPTVGDIEVEVRDDVQLQCKRCSFMGRKGDSRLYG